MTHTEQEALDFWQSSCEGIADRKIIDLVNTVDDLTTLAHNRAGAHTLLNNRKAIADAMRKLHDLYLETQPAV